MKIFHIFFLTTITFFSMFLLNNNTFSNTIKSDEAIGYYSTILENKETEINNAIQVCSAIDGTIIFPKGVFSFNNALVSTDLKKSYKSNLHSIDGELVDELAKITSQVSSTLYNAVLNSELNIIERHSSPYDFQYVPDGMDATVAFGLLDFKFENTKNYPILIKSFVFNNNIYTTIKKY